MKKEISTPISHSIFIGSTAAIAEALINHPLWALKLRSQSGAKFKLNPMILYRGILLHALSRIPVTAMQVTFSRIIQENIFSDKDNKIFRDLTSGSLGGGFAALGLAPAELIMTYQQKFGGNFWKQGKNIVVNRGVFGLSTGYLGTAIRLGSYTCSFFAAHPILKEEILKNTPLNSWQAHIFSAAVVGTLSTIISNPADVIKTIQQDQLPKEKLTITSAARHIIKTQGPGGFFKGIPARAIRVCSGIGIISFVSESMQEHIFEYKK